MRIVYHYLLTYKLLGAESFLRSYLVLQLVKKFPAFSEPEGSSPYPQAPATCPYPEPTPSSPHNSLPLPEDQVGTTVVNSGVILTETGQELLDGEVSIFIYVQGIEHSLKLLWRQGNLTAHSLST